MLGNPKRDAEICYLRRAGSSVTQLAAKFKLSGARIHQILARGGLGRQVEPKPKPPPKPQIDHKLIEREQKLTKKRKDALAEQAALARWERSNWFLSDPLWLDRIRRNVT